MIELFMLCNEKYELGILVAEEIKMWTSLFLLYSECRVCGLGVAVLGLLSLDYSGMYIQ